MQDQFTMPSPLAYTAPDELPPLVLPPGFESLAPHISGDAVKLYLYLLRTYRARLAEDSEPAEWAAPRSCCWEFDAVIEGATAFDPSLLPAAARAALHQLIRISLLATVQDRAVWLVYLTICPPPVPSTTPARCTPKRRRFSTRAWWAKLRAYAFRCAYCDTQDYPLVMEHVVALANGGPDELDNIVPACPPCNSKKGLKAWTPRPPVEAQDG